MYRYTLRCQAKHKRQRQSTAYPCIITPPRPGCNLRPAWCHVPPSGRSTRDMMVVMINHTTSRRRSFVLLTKTQQILKHHVLCPPKPGRAISRIGSYCLGSGRTERLANDCGGWVARDQTRKGAESPTCSIAHPKM